MQKIVSIKCRGFRSRCLRRRFVASALKYLLLVPRYSRVILPRYTYGGNFRFACAGSLRNIKLCAEQEWNAEAEHFGIKGIKKHALVREGGVVEKK